MCKLKISDLIRPSRVYRSVVILHPGPSGVRLHSSTAVCVMQSLDDSIYLSFKLFNLFTVLPIPGWIIYRLVSCKFSPFSIHQCSMMKAWTQLWSFPQWFLALLWISIEGKFFWEYKWSTNANHQKHRGDTLGNWLLLWVERSGLAWLWLIIVRANSPKTPENLI